MLGETLLLEELDGVVVGTRGNILHTDRLGMDFETVQHKCAKTIGLELGCNSQKHNLNKALRRKGPEDTATNNLNLTVMVSLVGHDGRGCLLTSLDLWPALPYQDGLVLPVHGESDDVIARHTRELLGNDVLQVDHIPHR